MRSTYSIIATGIMALAFAASAAAAETYVFDPAHSTVTWHSSHFGFSSPSGMFTNVSGTMVLDEANPENSRVTAVIDPNGLVTGLTDFDTHLKSGDFLDAAAYPSATFVSERVQRTSPNTAMVHGNLTLKGVTKPVTLNVRLNKVGANPMNEKKTAGFSASTLLKRSDFGIDYGLPGVGDAVRIDIQVEATLKEDQQ